MQLNAGKGHISQDVLRLSADPVHLCSSHWENSGGRSEFTQEDFDVYKMFFNPPFLVWKPYGDTPGIDRPFAINGFIQS